MDEKKIKPVSIYFLSFGLKLNHITIETIEALKKSNKIYIQAFDLGLEDFLKAKGVDIGKIVYINRQSKDFKTSAKLVCLNAKKHFPVAVLTYGWPDFINGFYDILLKDAEKNGLNIQVLYSVSSLSAIVHLAGIKNIEMEGIHIFNCLNSSFLDRIDFSCHIPCFILNAHAVKRKEMSGHFLSFKKKAEKKGFFVYLIEAASAGGFNQKAKLLENLEDINERSSLFISHRNII